MPDKPNPQQPTPPDGQILIYQDGATRLQVRLEGSTVWLSQRLIAELFQVSVKTANEHLVNIYSEGELDPEATIRSFRIVQTEGAREVSRAIDHYNLDAILAVGYRVRSARGMAFRQWATTRLAELLVKGFTMDDERLKQGRTLGADYFDELLERIRDIRASERMFYQKIADIYATSIDYDPTHPVSQTFFATVGGGRRSGISIRDPQQGDKEGGSEGQAETRERVMARPAASRRARETYVNLDLSRIGYALHQRRREPAPATWIEAEQGPWGDRAMLGCREAETIEGLGKHGFVLPPGRDVGAEEQEDHGEPFAAKYPRLLAEQGGALCGRGSAVGGGTGTVEWTQQ